MRTAAALLLVTVAAVAAPVPKAVKQKAAESPDGVWQLVAFSSDGAEPALPQSMTRDWVIENGRIYVGTKQPTPGGGSNFNAPDPTRPNEVLWGKNRAAYEVDGDTLRACYAHDGRNELTECKPEKGIHYYVFTRAK